MQIAKEDSHVAITLIDNGIPFTADEKGIKDSTSRYLNRNNTDYYSTISSVSAAGLISLTIKYDFKSSVKKSISDISMKIKLPADEAYISDHFIRLDGEIIDYTEEDGFITFGLDKTSGTITFSVTPNNAAYLMSYAQISYILNDTERTETIGIVNMATNILTLNVPDSTLSGTITVSGITTPRQNVSIFVDDTFVCETTASAVGNYSEKITLKNIEDGKIYKIDAKITNENEEETIVTDYVTYNSQTVELTEFKMYYRDSEYDLLELSSKSPVISWADDTAFTFVIDFNDCSKLDEVRIVSTKANETQVLEAVYDEENDVFIASGFKNYVPGVITAEYLVKEENPFESSDVELDSVYQKDGGINGYQYKVNLNDKDSTEFYYFREQQENADFKMTENMYQSTYDGKVCYITMEPVYIFRDSGCFYCQEIYVKEKNGSYTVTRTGIGLYGDSTGTEQARTFARKTPEEEEYENAKKEYEEILKQTEELRAVLEDTTANNHDELVYTELFNFLTELENDPDVESYDILTYKALLLQCDLVDTSSESFNKLNDIIDASYKNADDPEILLPSQMEDAMNDCVNAMNDAVKNINNQSLQNLVKKLTKDGWFGGLSLIEKLVQQKAKKYEEAEAKFKGNYAIDPSGYVFEATPKNRLSGVKATAYFKLNKDDEPTLWDASEFDQQNPLYTDANGCYAWDVPEGLWQVKYEKDGYETTYSEWLPVPPPQLEVNVNMNSLAAPEIEYINAYKDKIEISFSQYMNIDSVNSDNVIFTVDGKTVSGRFEAVDAQYNYEATTQYAKTFSFIPNGNISNSVNVTINNVENYCGTKIAETYSKSHDIILRIEAISVEESVIANYKAEKNIVVTASPANAAAGKTVTVSMNNSYIATAESTELTFDENGKATLKLTTKLPGNVDITFSIVDTILTETTTLTVTTETEEIKEHEHDYNTVITAPTCTEKGYTTYTCSCGDTYTADEVSATGHTPEVIPGKEATETETGLTDGEKCSVCDKILVAQTEIPKKDAEHVHDYTEVVIAPTCTENGYTICTCECGDSIKKDEVAASGHTPGEWEVVIEAQVGVEGKEQQKCTVCGELLDEKIIPALPEVNVTPGDVNGDGEITASDARIALRISAGLETLESANAVLEVVDINNDGEITASDARTILRKSAGLE